MFDASGHLFQIYFDIADVFVDGEKTSFKDLIVDVVYDPEGTAVVLDCDELEEAYHKNLISCTEKQMIIDTAERLKNVLESQFEQVNSWFETMYEKVEKIL
jgi:predicted RNA-binding protein associated with RNAse of E/G family